MSSRLPAALLAVVWMPGTSRSIRPWWHWWGSLHWALVTLIPVILQRQSSHCLWPQSLPFYNAWACSCYNGLGSYLGTSHQLPAVGGLSAHENWSWLQNLNGGHAGRMELGHPDPLCLMHPFVMVWAINHHPSPRLTRLTLSWACLPTQPMAPNSINMASHSLPKLSPSPKDHLP